MSHSDIVFLACVGGSFAAAGLIALITSVVSGELRHRQYLAEIKASGEEERRRIEVIFSSALKAWRGME